MEFFLQFGYGMMEHCRYLVREWKKGTVLLSPRDLDDNQLRKMANGIIKLGGSVLVDPQFYLPHSDHARLCAHDYWPDNYQTTGFWGGPELGNLLSKIWKLNQELCCSKIILPGLYASVIDDDWLSYQKATLYEAERLCMKKEALIATVALSSEAIRSLDQIHKLLEDSKDWRVSGIYLICEHPKGDYLVEDPNWLANVLDLIAGFRLSGLEVIVGYSNHQMIITAAAAANSLASGTWMNVRSFPPSKFKIQYDEEIKQRTTWYYAPQALSEFKIPFLDIAYRQNVLADMAPSSTLSSTYVQNLFSGIQPTTVDFTEKDAFRHYLHCLKVQVTSARFESFQQTIDAHNRALDEAENLLLRLHAVGVKGQRRDFSACIDANRAALIILETTRGAMLRRYWNSL